MQSISSFGQRLPLHRNRIAEFNCCVFIRARAPNFAVRNEATPNFSSVHQRSMVLDCNIRQGNALLDLGGLADIGQVQIVLGKSGPGQSKNGNTESSWLGCFHKLCALRSNTPLRFSGVPLPDNCFSFAFTHQRKSRGELLLAMFLDSPRLATLRHRRRSRLCWRCAEMKISISVASSAKRLIRQRTQCLGCAQWKAAI